MKTKWIIILAIAASFTMLVGCNSATPHLDQNWGKSYEQAKSAQTLNPEPTHRDKPVEGMDGRASTLIEDKYHDTFKTKAPRPVYNIDMPGVTSR